MERKLELHYRDELRDARAKVLEDAEAFPHVLFAIERTGRALKDQPAAMKGLKAPLTELARRSPLFQGDAEGISFGRVFDLVQAGRNEALHDGTYARHLADHAIQLALVLEDALVNGSDKLSEYMVRSPVVAELWQPLQFIRHRMLANSFSFLPVHTDSGWHSVSDFEIARLLRGGGRDESGAALRAPLRDVVEAGKLNLHEPRIVGPDARVSEILEGQRESAEFILVVSDDNLVGLLTPFDLL